MRILVVDLSFVFWSIALGATFRHTNTARLAVVRDIRRLADEGYDRVVIATDGPEKSFRALLWAGYKATRDPRPDHLWSLLEATTEHLASLGFHVFRAPPAPGGGWYEADDVIGSICAWARRRGHAVDIYSGDSDVSACVSDVHRCRLLFKHRGITELDEAGVEARFGVWPWQLAAYKAIGGDKTDGYGQIFPSIGAERARSLLEDADWDPLRVAERANDGAIGKEYDVIRRYGAGRIWTGLALATLRTDLSLAFDELLVERAPSTPPGVFDDLLPETSDALVPSGPMVALDLVDRPQAKKGAELLLTSPEEGHARLVELHAWCRRNLVENVDFGLFPGWTKPGLLHPGAQKLAADFGLGATFTIVSRDIRLNARPPLFAYEVRCVLRRKSDRAVVGTRIASANSRESFWAGTWTIGDLVPPHLDPQKLETRITHVRGPGGDVARVVEYFVPNPNPHDVQHKVLAMAEKRAFVSGVIQVTRCGGIFEAPIIPIPQETFGRAHVAPQWEQT
jgi:5'-3' exonuclease